MGVLAAVLLAQVLPLLDLMVLHNLLLLAPKEVQDSTLASPTPPAVRHLLVKQLLARCPSNSLLQSTQSLLLDLVAPDDLPAQVCNQPRQVVLAVLKRVALLVLEQQLVVQPVQRARHNRASALNPFLTDPK